MWLREAMRLNLRWGNFYFVICSMCLQPLPKAKARIMSFRNTVGSMAVAQVQSFLSRFKTPELVADYVRKSMIYYGEVPFLYRVFEPTDVRSTREKGGYKVVSTLHSLSSPPQRITQDSSPH